MGLVAWLSFQPLYLDTVCALEDLLISLLRRNMTPQGLQIIIEVSVGVHCCGCGACLPQLVSGPFLPAPSVVRHYRDSLIVSLWEGPFCLGNSDQIVPLQHSP